MKRRGFFGALLGMGAAPVVASVANQTQEIKKVYVTEPKKEAESYRADDATAMCMADSGPFDYEVCFSIGAPVETRPFDHPEDNEWPE